MNVWMIVAIGAILLCIYLTVRVCRLRKGLAAVLIRLAEIERKIPVLKP